jgi:hypothetical protein
MASAGAKRAAEAEMNQSFAAGVAILLSIGLPAAAAETPKRGGALTYMIPADAPPSFDGHREGTFATVHAVAPFYSVLVRVNPKIRPRRPISSAMSAPRFPSRRMAAGPTHSRSARMSASRTARP